jgi:tetratricopeptide (TPR) repeat protein
MKLTKVHLAALAFVAGVLPAAVYADGWFSRAGDKKDVTLTDVLKTPREYVDVEVKFKVYFDAAGKNFNPYFTRFNEECYGNFSAYPIDARLYDKRDFPRPYPFFFASKMDKTWKKVKDVDHLRVIEITGVVRDIFQGQPWIEVLDWSGSGGGLSEDDIRDVVRADANYVAGNYKDAARLYERADSSSLPGTVRADLQRRLGDAYYHAGEYGDAQDAYETGLRYAPESAVLKQGADASEAARQRARASRRGETVEGDAPEIAPSEQLVVESNGTDEVIRLLEDPAKVQSDVEAWRAELAARAAAVRGDAPDAVAVAGTQEEPAPTPAPETPVAEEPVVEPELVPAEGCTTEAPEACGEEAPEGCAGTTEDVEEPAEQPSGCAEEPAVAEPLQQPEQPEGTPESGAAEGTAEEPAAETGEAACGGAATEGCAEDTAEDTVAEEVTAETTEEGASETAEEGSSEGCGEEACGCSESEEGGETAVPTDDETVAVPNDERVVWVSGQMLRLPRLPFFGCEDVTDDDLRAIIEEVVQNPESDE